MMMKKRLMMLLTIPTACSSSATAPSPSLRTGAYRYSADVSGEHFAGTLNITYASRDSIAGNFAVPGLKSRLDLGSRNGNAYLVYVQFATNTRLLIHRIRPDLGCELREFGAGPGSCELLPY